MFHRSMSHILTPHVNSQSLNAQMISITKFFLTTLSLQQCISFTVIRDSITDTADNRNWQHFTSTRGFGKHINRNVEDSLNDMLSFPISFIKQVMLGGMLV